MASGPAAATGADRTGAYDMTISGLGPHGERAAPPERVSLLPDDRATAKVAGWRVAVVLHTLESDWAKQQLSGMVGIFGDCGAAVIDVVDCAFSPEMQVAELDRLVSQRPDAIISLPVANEQVAAAHRRRPGGSGECPDRPEKYAPRDNAPRAR